MEENKDLYHLHELSDYKVADDYPDVRGWEVADIDNRIIGKVDSLLVSKSAERVVYLDVEVNEALIEAGHQVYSATVDGVHEYLNKDGEDHLILPIGLVTLDEDGKKVHSAQVNYETFAKSNRFTKGSTINRDYELSVYACYLPGADKAMDTDTAFYDRKEFKRS